jgi:EAL domain-containing protein (putative c-di-GMP-specific phosphodiesterase class I)/GGDEF domain-containing protein
MFWLQVRNMRAEAQVEEGRQIISETEKEHLTGLYNWNYFLLYANQFCKDNPKKPMDAVVMNIERFHSVNALHGREFGDKVLRELGAEIQRFVDETKDGCRASRVEADRFDIYCPHREDWQAVLERFQAKMDKLFHNANIHLRMGVKPWQEGMEPVRQFDLARTACNKLRGAYKNQAVIFDAEMEQREDRDQQLLNDLTRALKKGELEVYYQPKYDIQAEWPRLSSAEALVRWRHPELGMLYPNEFIPLFEQSGRITELDNYVWKETARQIATWRDRHGKVLPVSVNLSRVDVFDPNLSATLDGIIARHGLNAGALKLEVTESAYTENAEQLIQVIEELRSKGYEIEMDDFGSGYSSLNMLSSLPIDVLKMDIAFIQNIERNEKDFRLVELIIDIARSLKVPVIAEGVETVGQLNLLRDAGCNLVQGYFFSAPLPAAEFERKLLNGID